MSRKDLLQYYPNIDSSHLAEYRTPNYDFSALKEHGITKIGELNPYITLACGLRCKYCYMYPFLMPQNNQTEQMNISFLLGMVKYFYDNGGKLDRTTLLGGEPTLHPLVTEIAQQMALLPIRERRMTTNGLSLGYLRLQELKPNTFDHVSVSIDGITSDVNDLTRGVGAFTRIITTMKEYINFGVKLSVNFTVTNNNIRSLTDIIPYFYNLGVKIINLHTASLDGNAYNHQDLIVSATDWIAARDKFLESVRINSGCYPGLKVRVPYIYLRSDQIEELGYQPLQERNYHSPEGGHRLIIFPPTIKGKGLCYMSADVIGQPFAHLGQVDANGVFHWNDDPRNEFTVYKSSRSHNVSTGIKGQENLTPFGYTRVSHSFKATINC